MVNSSSQPAPSVPSQRHFTRDLHLFPPQPNASLTRADDDAEEAAEVTEKEATARGYDYLLGMALWSLTLERVESLRAELAAKEAELKELLATTPKQLWGKDLDAFVQGLSEWEEECLKAEADALNKTKKGAKGKAGAKKAPPKKKGGDSDSDAFEDSDSDYDEKKKKKKATKKKAEPPAEKFVDLDALAAAEVVPVPLPAPIKASKKSASVLVDDDSAPTSPVAMDEDEGEGGFAPPAAVQAVVAPAKRKAPAKPAKAPAQEEPKSDAESGDEGGGMSLAQRIVAKNGGKAATGPSALSPLPKPAAKRNCDKGSPVNLSDISSQNSPIEVDEPPAGAPKRGGARKAAAKKAVVESEEETESESNFEEDDDGSDFEDEAPKSKAAPKAKAAAKPKAPPKKVVSELEASDGENEEPVKPAPKAKAAPKPKVAAAPKVAPKPKPAPKKKAAASESDEEMAPVPAAPRNAPRRAAAAAAIKKYTDDGSDEDESEEESDSGLNSDGSD